MMPDVTIRPFEDRDLEGVVKVLRDLQTSEKLHFEMMTPPEQLGAEYVHALRKEAEDAGGLILVATRNDEILGYCSLHTKCDTRDELDEIFYEYSYIGDLGVRADFRGQGIGRQLIHEASVTARRYGMTRLRLTVLAANQRGRAFYERLGFSEHLIEVEKVL
jgi:ribosomal protein S18 acetylase RimI-like enzyme